MAGEEEGLGSVARGRIGSTRIDRPGPAEAGAGAVPAHGVGIASASAVVNRILPPQRPRLPRPVSPALSSSGTSAVIGPASASAAGPSPATRGFGFEHCCFSLKQPIEIPAAAVWKELPKHHESAGPPGRTAVRPGRRQPVGPVGPGRPGRFKDQPGSLWPCSWPRGQRPACRGGADGRHELEIRISPDAPVERLAKSQEMCLPMRCVGL